MVIGNTRAALRVAAAIASIVLIAARVEAQVNCPAAMERADARIRAFNTEATKQGLDFAVDSGVSVALGDARKLILNHTTPATLRTAREMDAYSQKIAAWETVQKAHAVTIEDLWECLAPGSNCSLQGFAARQNAAFRRWMETFLSDSTQGALERVGKARSLLQNNVKQIGGDLQTAASESLGCMREYSRNAQAAEPVDARPASSPGSTSPPRPRSGMSGAAKGVLVGGLVAAGVGGAVILAGQIAPGEADTGTGSGGGSVLFAAAQSQFVCSAPDAVNLRRCSGTMIVRSGSPLTAGSAYTILTVPSAFHGTFTAGSSGTNINGIEVKLDTGSACPPTQTGAAFYRAGQVTTSIASVSMPSAPILCR